MKLNSRQKHQCMGMERLPDEIVLFIFSFLSPQLLFRSISLVCRRFYRLAYDCSSICRSKALLREINLQRKTDSSVQRVLKIITMLPQNTVKYISIQDCAATWQVFDVIAATCKGLKILNLASVRGELKLGKDVKLFAFHHLLELNISDTLIDDNFIYHLSQSCKALYSLNISSCPNVTDTGLMAVNFNLTLLNIAHCHFEFATIVHILCDFDVQVLCMQGIYTTVEDRTRLASMFPLCLEIGIPNICGLSLPEYQHLPEKLCFWCRNSNQCTLLTSDVDSDKLYEI